MDITEGLKKLQQLHLAGGLTDEEYALAKQALFTHVETRTESESLMMMDIDDDIITDPETQRWGMFLHLSMLTGFVIPFAGFILPFIIWQTKKNDLPGIEAHGRNAANWIISQVLYYAVFGILSFMLIGIPFLVVVFVLSIIFPIIAGVKSSNGEVWKYPLSIRFLK
ncbi:MAG: DUF4870 domain-containing protein [Chlorobi bacterium]|nr:MAG: hypothetical protein UZ07_CHB004002555 [Chlorobi bacterium OLB7]MBK8911602.1 DUF4870 domain-containing protein [Chlorobiota bacterium]MBX7215704.1 DUF4870 domain-containing protein [Candidatus Kapabacteria bacterium]